MCAHIRSKIQALPEFTTTFSAPSREYTQLVDCKHRMLAEVRGMKLINLADPDHKSAYRRQRENLDSIRATARRVFSHLPVYSDSATNVALGTISNGEGETLRAELSLVELSQIQKMIRIGAV